MKRNLKFRLTGALVIGVALVAMSYSRVQAQDGSKFPDSLYFYGAKRPAALKALEGKKMPNLSVKSWLKEKVTPADMKGKVVVVDFWATWCGPCIQAIPKNVSLVDKYSSKGLVFIGVHAPNGSERMAGEATKRQINYPLCVDNGASNAYKVSFWPTYIVIDRKGIVRAAGLLPEAVEAVVVALLAEKAPDEPGKQPENKPGSEPKKPDASSKIPSGWLEGTPAVRARFDPILAAANAPPITSSEWIGTESVELASLKGKVVLLDFWATWCGPCIRSIPKTNQIADKYRDRGLVVIGVCHQRGAEKMAAVVKEHNIKYPVCADTSNAINNAYRVDSFPDYYLIDRTGKLRIADVNSESLEAAIEYLLDEQSA